MSTLVIVLNTISASLATAAGLAYIGARDEISAIIVVLVVAVAVPAATALLSAAVRLRPVRYLALTAHLLGLAILVIAYVMAWMVSPGSGAIATAPLGLAGVINYLSMKELQQERQSSRGRSRCASAELQ